MADSNGTTTYDIPQKCKAGVVVNEGPDFHVEVQEVDVPEIGTFPPQTPTNLLPARLTHEL